MKKRIIAAIIMALAVIAILFSGKAALVVAVAFVALASVYEVCAAFGLNKKEKLPVLIYIMLSVVFIGIAKSGVIIGKTSLEFVSLVLTGYILLGFVMMLGFNEKVKIKEMFPPLLMSCILIYFLSYAIKVRTEMELGAYLIWTVLFGACVTDVFALFVGKYLGKRRLAPKISPNKTVEGAIGGMVGATLMMMVFGFIAGNVAHFLGEDITVNYLRLAILGFVSSIFAQIGDLSLSAIKRGVGIKDYGNLIPGHGGILDRVDSIIFVSPVAYYFLYYYPVFA